MLKELIIRILQANAQKVYTDEALALSSSHRLAYVIQYIRDNLTESISIDTLSEKACMSKSHFFRVFKNEIGISPLDFINQERIKLAVSLLKDPDRNIKEVFLACGFDNRSYFNRLFKRFKNVSPGTYKSQVTGL